MDQNLKAYNDMANRRKDPKMDKAIAKESLRSYNKNTPMKRDRVVAGFKARRQAKMKDLLKNAVGALGRVASPVAAGASAIKNFRKKKPDFQKGDYSGIKIKRAGGGSIRGYGAARTSGMGLQDEKLKPGKVYKAKRGSGLDLPVINSVKPTVNKTKRAQNLSGMKIQFNKQRSRSGINPNSLKKILMKTKNPYSDLVKTTDAGPKKYSSIPGASNSTFTERRKLLGATTGESGSTFTERRKLLRATAKAASATKIGKIALGVGAAGVAAQQYLKSKMKKDENEKTLKDFREQKKPGIPSEKTKTINSALNKLSKKMGGGIMKKYNMGGVSSKEVYLNARANVNAENRKYMNMDDLKEARRETYATAKDRYNISSSDKDILLRKAQQDRQDQTRKRILSRPDRPAEIPERLRRLKPKKVVGRNMGGMMQRPMGYRSGTMVKARGCKLGRTRPTKIT